MNIPIRVMVPGHGPLDLRTDTLEPGPLAQAVAELVGVDPDHCTVRADNADWTTGTTLTLADDRDTDEAPPAPPAWELTAVHGPDAGRRWLLQCGEHTIGRGVAAQVRPTDDYISRTHCTIAVSDARCIVTDAGSATGTTVDGVDADEPCVVAETGAVLRIGVSAFTLAPVPTEPAVPEADGRIAHNRPPRVPPYTPGGVHLPAPPTRPARARLTLVAALVPIGGGIAMWLVMKNPLGLLMGIFAPIAMTAQWLTDKRRGTKQWSALRREFRSEIDRAVADCETQAARWTESRHEQFPDPITVLRRARSRSPKCWDRRPGDADFGWVRIAATDPLAMVPVTLGAGGAPELRAEAERRLGVVQPASEIPVTVDVRGGAIGIAGAGRVATMQWITAALAATHSPRDLRIAVCADMDPDDDWAFAGWLPHVDPTDVVDAPLLVARSRTRSDALLHELEQLVATRRAAKANADTLPFILVVVPDASACDRATVAQLAEHGPSVGIGVIAGAANGSQLPGSCTTVVSTGNQHTMMRTPDGVVRTALDFDTLPLPACDELARLLAGLRDASAAASTAHLPTFVRLGDCLPGLEPDAIRARWAASRAGGPLHAPIGIGLDGPVAVDLREHGPHALIAGTTGAGKSVLLQSIVAAFAASHPPERLSFVLIDYKGGAAFGPCIEFPHVSGLVTDLDEGIAHRVLVALEAELRRREAILRDAGVADLAAMERIDMAGAPPNVCIVVDEFAALVREVPTFVDGMVDLAQRGRSLGMHLILATQKPAGVVNDRIRANTALRIALRTTDASDSIDVIGSDEAAHISRTRSGRAVVSLSANERIPIQSAYVGAPVGGTSTDRRVELLDLGRQEFDAASTSAKPGDVSETDLAVLVTALGAAAAADRCPPTRAPWLAPLPSAVPLDALTSEPGRDHVVTVGLRDEPATQTQPPHTIDLDETGAVLITGPAASGKSSALLTIATAACTHVSPNAVQVHVIDDGTGVLRILEALPHFGSAAAVHDLEATTRFLEFIERELESRRTLLRTHGVNDWTELRRVHAEAPARLIVLLDGLGAFLHTYERLDAGRWHDLLIRLVGDGRACGIHWCIASERRTGLPPALVAHASERIDIGGDPDALPIRGGRIGGGRTDHLTTALPGRAVIRGADVHLAHVGTEPSRIAAERALAELAARTPTPDRPVQQPFVLPDAVDGAVLDDSSHDTLVVPFGISDLGDPMAIDLRAESMLVCGPRGSGRTSALQTIARSAARTSSVVEINPRIDGVEASALMLRTLHASLSQHPVATVVVIDDGDLLLDGDAAAALEAVVRLAGTLPVRVVVACDTFTVARGFGAWIGELRRTRRALLLQPMVATDGDAFGVRLRARPGLTFPPGRGFLIDRGNTTLVQCALPA